MKSDDANVVDLIDQLSEENCADVLIGIGERDVIALNFDREAQIHELAVSSTIADVNQATQGAFQIEAVPCPQTYQRIG